jgi:CRISP-associated protein Cas1
VTAAETAASPVEVSKGGVVTIGPWGVQLFVEHGRLVACDTRAGIPRESRYARATCRIRRIVVLGTGLISLSAMEWLDGIGAAFLHLGLDGRVVTVSGRLSLDDPRLRRAQALAMGNDTGTAIARVLLRRKLDGQLRLARRLGADERIEHAIVRAISGLEHVSQPPDFLLLEAAAAAAYWESWRPIPITWARRDEALVPSHWRTYSGRTSPLTGSRGPCCVPCPGTRPRVGRSPPRPARARQPGPGCA